jgi:hypothetical protein
LVLQGLAMFAQPIRLLTLDHKWGDSFTIIDPLTGAPLNLTGLTAKIRFRPDWRSYDCDSPWGSSDWWNGHGAITAGTDTGEITNGGTNGTLTVNVGPLCAGVYKVRGETSVAVIATPFINGQLTIGRDGLAQMAINSLGSAAMIFNNGGILSFTGNVANLPTTLPATPGVWWNNGGVPSIS